MKAVNIGTMVWTGVVLVACLLLPAQLTAAPLLEYLYNETGTVAENTGLATGHSLADWGTFYDYTGNVPPWNHLDMHSADGTGVSGEAGDRAFDNSTYVFGNGGGMWGHTGVQTSPPVEAISQSMTISGWLKDIVYGSMSSPRYLYFNSNGSGPPTRTALLLHPGGTLQFTPSDGGNNISTDHGYAQIYDNPELPDEWTFFAMTWDGLAAEATRLKFYIGGETVPVSLMNANSSGSGPGWTENNKWFSLMNIGNAHGGIKQPVVGLLDNFRLHQGGIGDSSGALSMGDLEALRVADGGVDEPPPPPPPPPDSLWKIGTPITSYGHGPGANFGDVTPAKAQELAEGGFNMVWFQHLWELDNIGDEGLRGMFHAGGFTDDPTVLDNVARKAGLNLLINNVKDHPAMYAYVMADEPSATEFEDYGRLAGHIRTRDPNHMIFINLFPTYASNTALLGPGHDHLSTTEAYREYLRQYVDVVKPDMISYDHYHFRATGDGSEYFLNLALVREAALNAGIPFSNYVQAVALSPSFRVPTPNEGRWLAYTTLAYGGQGLQQFTYYGYGEFEGGVVDAYPDGTLTPLGEALGDEINPGFVAVGEQLQPLKSIGAYHTKPFPWSALPQGTEELPGNSPFYVSATTKILLGLFGDADAQLADATYALVVNLDYTSGITTTVFGPGDLSVFDATTGLWSAMGIDQVLLNLVPGGGTLVGLTSAILFPTTLLGDANLDDVVDLQDFSILKANFGTAGGWGQGNFNGDDLIDLQDFSIFKAHFGEHLPEPATLTLLLLGGLALLRRRR